jgi:hypothetical protein
MKLLFITFLVSLLTTISPAHAELIAEGSPIAMAQKALATAQYSQTALAMIATDADTSLDFWSVDKGVLMIAYSTRTGLVSNLSFVLMDERPKAERSHFEFSAVSFDTETGRLVLSTKKTTSPGPSQ